VSEQPFRGCTRWTCWSGNTQRRECAHAGALRLPLRLAPSLPGAALPRPSTPARAVPPTNRRARAQAAAQLSAAAERAGAGAARLPVGPDAPGGAAAALDAGEARRLAAALRELLGLKAAGNAAVAAKVCPRRFTEEDEGGGSRWTHAQDL